MSYYVDVYGCVVDEELDVCMILVDLDCVKVRNDGGYGCFWVWSVLVVVFGVEKVEVLGVVLCGGLCIDLVVDVSVVEFVFG